MSVTLRLLTPADWPIWRDLTLQALAGSPDAFRPTLAETKDQPDEWWQEIVGSTAEHERGNLWIAVQDDVAIGKLFATIDQAFTTLSIGAMWVDPKRRGTGVGTSLVDAALDWGKEHGLQRCELWVTDANEAAVRFYASLGFEPTGDTQMLREGSDLAVRKMTRYHSGEPSLD